MRNYGRFLKQFLNVFNEIWIGWKNTNLNRLSTKSTHWFFNGFVKFEVVCNYFASKSIDINSYWTHNIAIWTWSQKLHKTNSPRKTFNSTFDFIFQQDPRNPKRFSARFANLRFIRIMLCALQLLMVKKKQVLRFIHLIICGVLFLLELIHEVQEAENLINDIHERRWFLWNIVREKLKGFQRYKDLLL